MDSTRKSQIPARTWRLALGGGLDVRLGDRVSVSAFQIDYNPVFLRNRDLNLFGNTQSNSDRRLDNIRFSFGLVFH